MTLTLYILGDADRVRARVEAALFAHDLAGLTSFSAALTNGITKVVDKLSESLSATMVMAGGDDVLFSAPAERFRLSVLEDAASDFAIQTGCTISFGVGTTLEIAYVHLRRAKALGGGVISLGPNS